MIDFLPWDGYEFSLNFRKFDLINKLLLENLSSISAIFLFSSKG
jgi:hypothetical protein